MCSSLRAFRGHRSLDRQDIFTPRGGPIRHPAISSIALLILTACGGVNPNTPLDQVSQAEAEAICTETQATLPTESFTCEETGDTEWTPEDFSFDYDYCVQFEQSWVDCDVTVGESMDCIAVQAADPCWQFREAPPAECEALFACDNTEFN